jgi:RimJ/RimL family protein N-acetyltransferase
MSLWTQAPIFTGTHVTLRPLVPEDRDAVVAAASDGKLWELFYTVVPGPETVDAWLASAFRDQSHARALPFAVLDKAGTLIGSTRYMRMAPENRRLEIGSTFYAARTQRTPVNTETKLLLLRHAFEAMDCVCVQIRTDFLNRQSQRAIERLGAKKDGVIRGRRILPDGRVRDMVVYSMLAHEWGGVRSNLEMMLSRGTNR